MNKMEPHFKMLKNRSKVQGKKYIKSRDPNK